MFNYIKNIFTNKKFPDIDTVTNDEKFYISFSVDSKDNLLIRMIIRETNTETSNQLGDLLFNLNEGYLAQSILEVMNEIATHDTDHYLCIKNIIHRWSKNILNLENKNESSLNEPIVNPSSFNTNISK